MRMILLVMFLMTSQIAVASDRDQKIATLIELFGLRESIDQQMAQYSSQLPAAIESTVNFLSRDFDLGPEHLKRIHELSERYEASIAQDFSGRSFVEEFSKSFGPQFTDAELDELIAVQSTALARKTTKAANEAVLASSQVLNEKLAATMNQSLESFSQDLQKILLECKCIRKKP